MRLRGGGLFICMFAALLGAVLVPAVAGAATVVNGGFETGSLSGWNEQHDTEAGDWFAYRGTEPPLGPGRGLASIPAPPQGRFAAISDERDPDTMILWQDVALEPGATQVLSLQAFYESQLPLTTPVPDSLTTEKDLLGGQGNEQFRVDVIKPTAPLDSVAPEDVLATLFQTETGSPKTMAATRFSANLTPFAGQTVRIRAVVVNQFTQAQSEEREQAHENLLGVLNAGIDNVAITSAGPGLPGDGPKKNGAGTAPVANRISLGHPRPNPKNGTAVLPVKTPSAGHLTASTVSRRKPPLILAAKKRVAGATTANLVIKPTAAGRAILERRRKLRLKVAVAFDPAKGAEETKVVSVVLRLATPKTR
jgi:hypothetical protein